MDVAQASESPSIAEGRVTVDFEHYDVDRHVLGALCQRGHDFRGTGKSLRYKSTGHTSGCVLCAREYRRTKIKQLPGLIRSINGEIAEGFRKCKHCQRVLPLEAFGRTKRERDNERSRRCRDCWRAYRADYYERKPEMRERMNARSRLRHKSDWMDTLLRGSMSGAKTRGLEHSITRRDIETLWEGQAGRCYWLAVPMVVSQVNRHPLQPSLDRLDRRVGYVPTNVVLSSHFANMGRSVTEPDDFRSFLQELKTRRAAGPA